MSESKLWRLREQERPTTSFSGGEALRWLIRAVLIAAILAMALLRGYSERGITLLLIALTWALLLPFALRAGGALLTRMGVEGRPRLIALVVLAVVLLAGFAVGASQLVGAG